MAIDLNVIIQGLSSRDPRVKSLTIKYLKKQGVDPQKFTKLLNGVKYSTEYLAFGKINPHNPIKLVNDYSGEVVWYLGLMSLVIVISLILIIVVNWIFIKKYENRFDETDPEETSKGIINGFYVTNVALLLATLAVYLAWVFCCSKTIEDMFIISIFTFALTIGYITVLAAIPKTYFGISEVQ